MSFLMHYGTPRHSGRYPWGSGENPYQRYGDFYSKYHRLKKQGLSEKEMAQKLGVLNKFGKPDIRRFRAKVSNAVNEKRAADRNTALKYKEEGLNNSEIGRKMGINESTVRSLLDESRAQRRSLNQKTADVLKNYIDQYRYVDVGPGLNNVLGVTKTRVDSAIAMLEEDGYKKQFVLIDQMGTNHKTTVTVMTPGDVSYSELSENRYNIKFPGQESVVLDSKGDVGRLGLSKPPSVSSDRIMINYAETGGTDKDGLIELRRGVDDISLGNSQYAQVRIAVDDNKYMKGMAVYRDDMPPGVDVIFNTNKHSGTDKADVFKSMRTNVDGKVDWDNPFGASVTQKEYIDREGKKHISAINIVHEQGDWQGWDKNTASQFLSKQPLALADRQLKLAYADKKAEFEEIKNLTNPTVKKKLLMAFADKCDSTAVELKGAPFSGQQTHVILPFPDLKDNEIYAPNYKDGTRVALVRYPHGGTFEIPELTVRNRGSVAESVIKNAPDAVGINGKVAARLSGADFDGDSVVVIPLSDKVRVRSTPALEGLKDFDPKERYPKYEGMKVLSEDNKQREMGIVSNLITDMTLKGATPDEIARAVRHSMVVIDATKHELNYKQSEIDNGISELKKKYQSGGASTIISRSKSPENVPVRKDWSPSSQSIGPNGEKIFSYTGETYQQAKLKSTGEKVSVHPDTKTGGMYYISTDTVTGKKVRVPITLDDIKGDIKTIERTQKSKKMAERDDAYTLTSGGSKEHPGYPMEKLYAEYANNMKALGNAARKAWLNTREIDRNKEAAVKYKAEVDSLNEKLRIATSNAPYERHAQLVANQVMDAKKAYMPDMDKDKEKKYRGQAIIAARDRVGSRRQLIEVSDKEWAAIQNGAISKTKLRTILDNSNLDVLREKATPRKTRAITSSMKSLAKSMSNSGYTTAQIADRLGISVSSVYTIVSA